MFKRDAFGFRGIAATVLMTVVWLGGGSGPAFAGAGDTPTTVVPQQTNTTYSSVGTPSLPALDTYLAYEVTITNSGGNNTINNIRFTGATAVTDPAEKAEYSSVEGPVTCERTNTDGTAIACTIGQLKAGAGSSFVVFFKAPVKVTNGVADGENSDKVSFTGTTYYAEGTGGVPQSTPQNSTEPWEAAQVTLGTSNPTLVRTAVQKSGGSVFTGNGSHPNSADPFATLVKVPAATTYTTAQVKETELVGEPNCNSFGVCWQTQLTIPGTFSPYLDIELTMDKSNIKSGTKIETVVLEYVSDTNVLYPIGLCEADTTPRSDGVPCIVKSRYYKNRSVPGWTADLDGDFRWWLISKNNGWIRVK